MLAFIINFIGLFWPYIFIVSIGNFITRLTLECNSMQSTLEEEVDPFEKTSEETKPQVKKTTKRRKKSKSNKTSDIADLSDQPVSDISEGLLDLSTDSVETYLSSLHDNKPPKYHPFCSEVDLNEDVTKIFDIKANMSKFFVVNEDIFLDLDRAIDEEEEYRGYHLYKVMKSPEAPKMDVQDEELTVDDLTEDLFVSEERTKHGVIINSNVYLTTEQWHTIRELKKDMFSCTVCQFQCDAATLSEHIRSVAHARKLDGHRPLKRFDLSITRKINENLHCAVCNSMFPIKNYRQHENSKSHEETLLTAINKVTDILYDDGHIQKNTQSFNSNNIQAPNNAPNHWLNFSDVSRNDTYSPRAEAYSPRAEAYSPRAEAYSPRAEAYSPRSDDNSPRNETFPPSYETFTPSYENTPRSDSYSENRVQTNEVESKNFNFRNMFGDIKIYEEDEVEEYIPPIEGISYASMASKPRVNVPKFLKIDLGTKEVRVKYESWNMITPIDCNQVYCMVCKSHLLVRHKIQHCMADEHKALLVKCNVVGAFEDYLIRNVNDKLYHCGHCNNLQVKNDIQLHIEKYHPMKNGNMKDINPLQIFPETKPKAKPLSMEQVMKDQDMYGDCKLCPFGTEMVVSNLGCHTLMLGSDGYVCVLCNEVVQGDLLKHVYEPSHVQFSVMTPFIKPFQNNLTRAIRGSLHCLLCNTLVSVREIYSHNVSAAHTAKLARALGMRRSERPTQEVKYQCEGAVQVQDEYKAELERFMSTLPPQSRDALSKLTIKNHMGELVQLSNKDASISPSPVFVSNSPTPSGVSKNYKQGQPISYKASVNINTATFNGIYPPLPSPLHPSQMVTVSMLESGIPHVRTGSPVAPFRPPLQLPITGPMDLKMNHGVARIPVSPIRRKEDVEVANEVLSLYKQSPVKTKASRRKPMETVSEENKSIETMTEENLVINVENGKKIEKVDSINVGEDKADKNEKKKKTGKGDQTPPSSTSDDEELPFKLDEPVLLKIKTSYFKITNTAYQTLVHLSNGSRYCFVCSQNLDYSDLRKHVECREHIDNIAKNKFLCNFNGQLLRQMYLMYHCGLCNVTMSRRDIKHHHDWPTHLERQAAACKKVTKKILKSTLQQGVKELIAETQKEYVFANIPEPIVNIVTYVQSVKKDFVDRLEERKLVKKSQMIILKGTMLKISFESWHGIITTKSGTRCILCQTELTQEELPRHVDSKYHNVALGIPFHKQYFPALARQINPSTMNCVICNLELSADDSLVAEHIAGRKHEKNYNDIVERTLQADCYSDCYKYPVTL